MSIFTYTLPSGAQFKVVGPANATQQDADQIFYSQVAAGSFVGYTAGQTLSSVETELAKFDLSRLDRGTAGVDDSAVLSIFAGRATGNRNILTRNGQPIFQGTDSNTNTTGNTITPTFSTVVTTDIISSIPNLDNIPLSSPISQANVAITTQGLGSNAIGPLTGKIVESLLAQNATQTGQPYTACTNDKGIGKYGFTSVQLEEAGYLKPGTTLRFLNPFQVPGNPNPENFTRVMNTAAVWTGLGGIYSLDDLLANEEEQDRIQEILMNIAYTKLTNAGVVSTPSTAGVVALPGFIYTATTVSAGTLASIDSLGSLINPSTVPTGLAGQITAAVNSTNVDIPVLTPAQAISNSLSLDPTASLRSIQTALTQGQVVLGQVQQNIGSLTQVASKYGTQAADLWSKGLPGLQDRAGSIIRGQVAGIQNQATAIVKGVQGQAQAVVAQGKATIDSVGKMGKYAVDFANGKMDSLTLGYKKAAAFSDTVNRSTVDQAVKGILGNPKIPEPNFSSASALSASVNADIDFAKNALAQTNNQINSVLASGRAIAGTVQETVNQGASLFAQTQNIATGAGTNIARGIRLG